MTGPEYILLAVSLAFNLFMTVMCLSAHRHWRRCLKRAQRAERNLADVFDTKGAGMTLAREIRRAKVSKGDWERRMDANPRPTS